ncbi:site-2 protease family protein [Patescibacteria group bacterium]|nr:site-2 protease family protein [Patescibacteria group bacterium]MCL5091976.1 site-2 protease family protein [Patescibacteria group bacterium]
MLNILFSSPLLFAVYVVALLIGLSVHEFAHAWTADRLGDPTARLAGRMQLNPLVHIDVTGLLFILFFGFGWGKPVLFDPFNLKNPRKDAALISLAGPSSNILLAVLLSAVLHLLNIFGLSSLMTIGSFFLAPIIIFNVMLGVFNFIPISPLDGFKIVGGLLSRTRAEEWYQLERYGIFFLLLMILPIGRGSMLNTLIQPIINFIANLLIPNAITGSMI